MWRVSGCSTEHCQDVGVWACSDVEWTQAIFPNLLGQGPREAEPLASMFWHQLHTIHCSHEFRFVVCGVLAPPCAAGLTKPLPPCREVCDSAMEQCLPIMEKYYLSWPNETFTCQQLPYSHQEPCLRYHQGEVVFPPGVNTDCSHQEYDYADYDYDEYDHLPTLTLHEDRPTGSTEAETQHEDDTDAGYLGFFASDEVETYYDTIEAPNTTLASHTPPPTTTTISTLTTSRTTSHPPESTTPRIRFAPAPTPTTGLSSRSPAVSTDQGTSYLHGAEIVNG